MALPAMSLSLNGTIQSAMKVQEFCKSIKNATKELSERALQVEVYSADICAQTKFLDQVSPLLVIEHRQLYTKTLKEARLKLEDVNKKLVEFQTLIEQGTGSFIVDTVVSASPSTSVQQTVIHDVENLAKDLREIKSSFGLLQCKGVVENEPSKQKSEGQTFDLVFKMPPNLQNPQSLRSALLGREKPHTLSDVVRLGLEMAKSVSFVHSLNFVHKSIRPEAILVFQEPSTNSLAPFLVGFEKFREHQGDSARIGSEDWKLNMYAHPKRYGLRAEDSYVMQHDIYSLGVCLLEIGLWESFISYEKPEDPPTMSGLLAHSRQIATSQGSTFF
ncbi:hypothetical protein TrVGV298_011341 [Trichoderma virens]|nr:hypothetical protein TrVGV298_011341 [Trichoderma virens]